MKFDIKFQNLEKFGFKVALITDPAGTNIELTEGLTGK